MEPVLKTPRFGLINNSVFIIPNGFLYASIFNSGSAGVLKVTNVLNEEISLNPGDVFDLALIAFPYSQVTVDGTGGASGKITYLT